MPEQSINGTVFAYEDAGEGAPLLLLHGGLGTARLHWWREIPVFAAHYRVIAPDMRGYGRSSPPRTFPFDFYQQDAADMAALLDALSTAPAHVIGWSDGAVVALVMAVHYPHIVRSLTVISGEARLLPQERAVWPVLAGASTWSGGARERFIVAQGPLNWPGILDAMVAGYNRVLDERGGEIVSQRVHEIRCPTLILHGDADPTVPVQHAYELHTAIAGSRLHLYPGTGHLPQREHGEDLRARVLAFLAEH